MPAAAALRLVRDSSRARTLLEPLRMRLLNELRAPQSAVGLSRRLGLPRQKLNYHLRELERAGFVELLEERRKGNCVERVVRATARAYVIDPAALGDLDADPAALQDRFSAAYLIALSTRTIRELSELRERSDAAGKRLATLGVDTRIRFRSAAERAAFAEELTAAVAGVVARYHDDTAPGGRSFRLVLGAYPETGAPAAGGGVGSTHAAVDSVVPPAAPAETDAEEPPNETGGSARGGVRRRRRATNAEGEEFHGEGGA